MSEGGWRGLSIERKATFASISATVIVAIAAGLLKRNGAAWGAPLTLVEVVSRPQFSIGLTVAGALFYKTIVTRRAPSANTIVELFAYAAGLLGGLSILRDGFWMDMDKEGVRALEMMASGATLASVALHGAYRIVNRRRRSDQLRAQARIGLDNITVIKAPDIENPAVAIGG